MRESKRDADSLQQSRLGLFSSFLGSPEVEVSSWQGQFLLANRLEAAMCDGDIQTSPK
jgi:hypothetical protein